MFFVPLTEIIEHESHELTRIARTDDKPLLSPDKRGFLSPDNGGTEGGVKTIEAE